MRTWWATHCAEPWSSGPNVRHRCRDYGPVAGGDGQGDVTETHRAQMILAVDCNRLQLVLLWVCAFAGSAVTCTTSVPRGGELLALQQVATPASHHLHTETSVHPPDTSSCHMARKRDPTHPRTITRVVYHPSLLHMAIKR